MNVRRYDGNPVLTPLTVKASREDFEVVCTFNAGVTTAGNETLMMVRTAERPRQEKGWVAFPAFNADRAEIEVRRLRRDDPNLDLADPRVLRYKGDGFLTSISHQRLARSRDGLSFTADSQPVIAAQNHYESFGTEDSRITRIGGKYFITYVGVSPLGVSTCLAVTKDFKQFERMGMIFCPDNRDVVLFPEKLNGMYAAYHRPAPRHLGSPGMWLAYSPDLVHWGRHAHVIEPRRGAWDSGRVGGGAPPIKTEKGWLSIYHGATPDDWYSLGALLTDLEQPQRVLARSRLPLLKPEAKYEMEGFYGHVVFTCGTTLDGDRLRIYYGGADTVMAVAELSLQELLDDLQRNN